LSYTGKTNLRDIKHDWDRIKFPLRLHSILSMIEKYNLHDYSTFRMLTEISATFHNSLY